MENKEPKYKIGDVVTYTCDADGRQYNFKIVRTSIDDIGDIYYYDSDGSGSFLAEDDIDGIARDSIKITEESLLEDGWEVTEILFDDVYYKKTYIVNGVTFHCDVRKFGNMVGREWNVHIDNDRFESIGDMDVATFGQIDKFIELLSE